MTTIRREANEVAGDLICLAIALDENIEYDKRKAIEMLQGVSKRLQWLEGFYEKNVDHFMKWIPKEDEQQ